MGIVSTTSDIIMREAKYKPFDGDVLVIGRQTVYMTPDEVLNSARRIGLDVGNVLASELGVDHETRIGGEDKAKTEGHYISDKAYLSVLGVNNLTFLDHSDYEGASLIVDVNEPAPAEFANKFDLIIDGGCFDNVFNPAQALKNCAMMLKPKGRLITFNLYSNHYDPYTMVTPNWFIDYFAVNQFDNCHIYMTCYQPNSSLAVYVPELSRSLRPHQFNNFASAGVANTIGIWAIAQKGEESTWERSPSQRIYRDDDEWAMFEKGIQNFLSNPRPYSAHSVGQPTVDHPPYREFLFIDTKGTAWPIDEYNRQHPAAAATPATLTRRPTWRSSLGTIRRSLIDLLPLKH